MYTITYIKIIIVNKSLWDQEPFGGEPILEHRPPVPGVPAFATLLPCFAI